MRPDEVDALVARLNAAHIPRKCGQEDMWLTLPFDIGGGWTAHCFYDGDEFNYVDSFTSPDGAEVQHWDWPEGPERDALIDWRP